MPELTVLSLGAGVQSSTILLMSEKGELPRLDLAIFADTGWEPETVYRHLDRLSELTDIPIVRVNAGRNLREQVMSGYNSSGNDFFDIPAYTAHGGLTVRQCTTQYKINPIKREIRRRLPDYPPPKRPPAGSVEQWIGISLDEVQRMKPSREQYIVNRWPLIDLRMTRGDCLLWWERHYPGITPPKSACLGCPFHSTRVWVDLYRKGGREWDETVEVDERLREDDYPGRRRLDGDKLAYLHNSCRPLREVVPELARRQDENPQLPGLAQDGFGNECEGHCGV